MRPFVIVALSVIGVAFVGSVLVVERATEAEAEPASRPDAYAKALPPRDTRAAPPVIAVAPPIPVEEPVAASPPPTPRPVATAAPPERVRARAPVPQPPRESQLELSFRLDPRLTRSLHMGDRWVAPPTYSIVGDAKSAIVEARARLTGGASPAPPAPAWTASQPDMVEVSPERGDRVKITVWRAGESRLTVESGGLSRTVVVHATAATGGALRVSISQ